MLLSLNASASVTASVTAPRGHDGPETVYTVSKFELEANPHAPVGAGRSTSKITKLGNVQRSQGQVHLKFETHWKAGDET